jgi:hypothetical protein
LGLGAGRDQRRADEVDADGVDLWRRVRPCHFLAVDGLFDEGRAAPAVLLGPVNAGPAALVEGSLPVSQELDAFVALGQLPVAVLPARRQVLRQPLAEFLPERLVVRIVLEVHTFGKP